MEAPTVALTVLAMMLTACWNKDPEGRQPVVNADTVTTRHAPEALFQDARMRLAGSPGAAATDLHEAARFVRDEAALSGGKAEDALEASAGELDHLSAQLRGGSAPTVATLDAAALRTHAALALAHVMRAERAREKEDNHRAGDELTAAAGHFKLALTRAGDAAPSGAAEAAQQAESLGEGLVRGSGWTPEAVARSLTEIQEKIDELLG